MSGFINHHEERGGEMNITRNMCILFILSLIVIPLVGCATYGRKIDQTSLEKIKKGETTREEVIQLLGSPDQITKDTNGNITMMYMYVRATAKPESFIPVVGAFAGGTNTQNQMVMITIGPDGKVSDIFTSYGASESGYGLSSGGKADLEEVEENKRPK